MKNSFLLAICIGVLNILALNAGDISDMLGSDDDYARFQTVGPANRERLAAAATVTSKIPSRASTPTTRSRSSSSGSAHKPDQGYRKYTAEELQKKRYDDLLALALGVSIKTYDDLKLKTAGDLIQLILESQKKHAQENDDLLAKQPDELRQSIAGYRMQQTMYLGIIEKQTTNLDKLTGTRSDLEQSNQLLNHRLEELQSQITQQSSAHSSDNVQQQVNLLQNKILKLYIAAGSAFVGGICLGRLYNEDSKKYLEQLKERVYEYYKSHKRAVHIASGMTGLTLSGILLWYLTK